MRRSTRTALLAATLLVGCGDATGPEEPQTRQARLKICTEPDTIFTTVRGEPAIIVIQHCWW